MVYIISDSLPVFYAELSIFPFHMDSKITWSKKQLFIPLQNVSFISLLDEKNPWIQMWIIKILFDYHLSWFRVCTLRVNIFSNILVLEHQMKKIEVIINFSWWHIIFLVSLLINWLADHFYPYSLFSLSRQTMMLRSLTNIFSLMFLENVYYFMCTLLFIILVIFVKNILIDISIPINQHYFWIVLGVYLISSNSCVVLPGGWIYITLFFSPCDW